jgi:NADH dehydrogenase
MTIRDLPGIHFVPVGTDDDGKLTQVFAGCETVVHCAGINREIGQQTYRRVHIEGTRNVINAAKRAGVRKIAIMSFLRARPECGSPYHESKWAAEEVVRTSGLDYTVLKAGVIYGRGDHMLDHLSHAFHTFPVFALVGMTDKSIRPTAVEDVARVLRSSLIDNRLSRQTVAVMGPEEMTLAAAVRRVAQVVGKKPAMFRMPLAIHKGLASLFELTMKVPLLSVAQLRILSEGIVEPLPFADPLPEDLKPTAPFSMEQIERGLPSPARFSFDDCRWHKAVCSNK